MLFRSADGRESGWSQPVSLIYDSTPPALSLPQGSIVGDASYTFAISQTEKNPERVYVEIQQMVNNKWKKLNGQTFYGTAPVDYTIDPASIGLKDGVQTQLKVNSWDRAGNQVSAAAAVTVDRESPVGSIRYGNTAPINGNVIAYLSTEEDVQAPTGWDAINGSARSFKKKYTKNTTEVIALKDVANNSGTAQVAITWIDKDAPVVAISSPGAQFVDRKSVV